MPPRESSQLASYPKSINLSSVCCDRFERKMTNLLPLELRRPPPASKFDKTAMLLGHMATLAMHWVKKWTRLWQNFSRALMKAILKSIAKGACRVASAAPLQKAKRPLEEEQLGRDESKTEDREKLNCEAGHQRYLILNSCSQEEIKSLTEDRYFGEEVMKGPCGAEMDQMHQEDNAVLCLIRHSISLDFGSDWEYSSDEDVAMEEVRCPETFPQKLLEGDCPQVIAKELGARGHLEENERGSCSPLGEFGASENIFEGDYWQSLESPSISKERREGIALRGDFMIPEEENLDSTSDFSKDGEYLTQYGNAKETLGRPTISYDFKSPLVLSLFYSPSEEDDDDSEDWSSEDEMEETSQSYIDGAVSENVDNSSAEGDNSQLRGFPENLCGSLFPSMDPLHSFCFSKAIQPATFSPPEPKKHKEITVSFYLKKPDNSPKPSSHKDSRSATEHLPHRSCQLQTERNCDLVTTETSLVSQMDKKVRFSPTVTVHTLVVWDYASRAARRGPWEEMARDRCRFWRRIAEVGAILEPCLEPEHRAKAWRKIHGALEDSDTPLHNSSEEEMLHVSKV